MIPQAAAGSVSQPFVRPIVRGKAGKPVEFGAKLDISAVAGRQRGKARLDKADLPPHLAQQRHLGSEVDAAQADVLASQLAVGIL